MRSFISFSGGVESRTLALLYGNVANAIFADTGWEHPELYRELDLVQAAIQRFHGNDFQIIRLQAHNVEGTGTDTLPAYIAARKFYPSPWARFCTRLFKIQPIDDFLAQFAPDSVRLLIGLNADEAESRTGNHGLLPHVQYSYPLVDRGITRALCLQLLTAAGLSPHFPPYMRRGGCIGCPFKSRNEFMAMAVLDPERFDQVADLEHDIQDHRTDFFHVIPGIHSLREFKSLAQSQLFTPTELYPALSNASACGVFCNR